MLLPNCQVMLENRMQCNNIAVGSNAGVDYCRLHFSFMISKMADSKTALLNPVIYNDSDQEYLDTMIAQTKKAKQEEPTL